MADILERLRAVQSTSVQYAAGSDIIRDAADEIERLRNGIKVAAFWTAEPGTTIAEIRAAFEGGTP